SVHPRPARSAQMGLSLPPPDAEEARDRSRLLAADPARREDGAAPSSSPPGPLPPSPAPGLARLSTIRPSQGKHGNVNDVHAVSARNGVCSPLRSLEVESV